MRKIIISLVFMICCKSNLLAQNNIKNAQIEYTANTRGFYQKIWVNNQVIAVSEDRNDSVMPPTTTKITLKDWKFLNAEFKKMKLSELSKLNSPTNKRRFDGAAFADLKIFYNGTIFQTQPFDNGFPNVKVKKFVDKITSLAKKKE